MGPGPYELVNDETWIPRAQFQKMRDRSFQIRRFACRMMEQLQVDAWVPVSQGEFAVSVDETRQIRVFTVACGCGALDKGQGQSWHTECGTLQRVRCASPKLAGIVNQLSHSLVKETGRLAVKSFAVTRATAWSWPARLRCCMVTV